MGRWVPKKVVDSYQAASIYLFPMSNERQMTQREMSRRGGIAAASKLTRGQRQEKARRAAQARWRKRAAVGGTKAA